MGVWPKGTIVSLTDKRVAIVREENEGNAFLPQVEVVSEDSRYLFDLSRQKDVKVKESLNPLKEGKKYVKFL